MTIFEECEILCDVINSQIDRIEQRVHNWFPEVLHFKHYDEVLELRNITLHQLMPRRKVPQHLTWDKEECKIWHKEILRDMTAPFKYGKIYVTGRYNTIDSVLKKLDECVEFNEDIFK